LSILVNFISQDSLPTGVLFSAYLGNEVRGYYQQIRTLSNGDTQVREADSTEWRTVQ
jgi:hypothetical protein